MADFTELGSTGLRRSGGYIDEVRGSSAPRRLMAKVEPELSILRTDECWTWSAARNENGYGTFYLGASEQMTALAHRVSYSLLHGEWPIPGTVDHLCRNRGCLNPSHLEAVSHPENMSRSIAGYRAENPTCRRCGHSDWGVTHAKIRRNPSRHCKECARRWRSNKAKAAK